MARVRGLYLCSFLLFACDGSAECTEIDCSSKIVLDYGEVNAAGAYDLLVTGTGVNISARCNDPGSMEELENPPELDCSTTGFELVDGEGIEVTTLSSLTVTVVRVADDEVLIGNVPVSLTVAQTLEPNGPGCEPVCFERHGIVVF